MPLSKEEILLILSEIIELSSPFEKNGEIVPKGGLYPEYWYGYNKAVSNHEKIKIHAEKGFFPNKLFEERSPNQTEEELDWIKKNYKQVTLSVFDDYINTMGRAWHKSNWSIEYIEDDSTFTLNTFKDFVQKEIKGFGSLEYFMRSVMPVLKAKDAEGVIVIKPDSLDFIETEDGFMLNDRILVEPTVKYFESKKIVYQKEGHYMIETGEKSPVEYGTSIKNIGRVFEFYDERNIWKIKQVGKKIDNKFEIELFFEHEVGSVPVHKLMGIPRFDNSVLKWESPFLHAVDNLDLVLLDSSHLAMSKAKSVYPVRVMAANECDYTEGNLRCDMGNIHYYDQELGKEIHKKCHSCDGTGLKHRVSPFGDLLFDPKNLDEGNSGRKLLEYVSPDVSTLEFLQSQINSNFNNARKVLHLNTSDDKADGSKNVTATAKALEHKALIANIKNVADQEFGLYEWALAMSGVMRYGNSFKGFVLNKPSNYDFVTEEDYISQISTAKAAGVPPIALRFILIKYVKSVFGSSDTNSKVIDTVIAADRLLELDSDELSIKRASGLIMPYEDIIHCSGVSIVNEIIETDPEFLDRDIKDRKELVISTAKIKAQELNQDVVEEVI